MLELEAQPCSLPHVSHGEHQGAPTPVPAVPDEPHDLHCLLHHAGLHMVVQSSGR